MPTLLNIIISVVSLLIVSPHLPKYIFNLCKLEISSYKINKPSLYIRQFSLFFQESRRNTLSCFCENMENIINQKVEWHRTKITPLRPTLEFKNGVIPLESLTEHLIPSIFNELDTLVAR